MLYQEIRPYRFDDMVGQNYIVENIRAQAKRDAWFHSFILAGQFGSGKTTMARIIAMAANCQHKDENGNPCGRCESCQAILAGKGFDYKEIDGASNTGIDNIRELKEYVSFKPVSFAKKVIIIDEVHKLSNAAFNSLLKVLEEPPEYALFVLCTTEAEAIPETVQSRCAIYRFGAIPEGMIASYLQIVAKEEGIELSSDAALLIAKYSSGAMRNALKYLEQLSASTKVINEELVASILGIADTGMLFDLLSIYMEGDVSQLPEYINVLLLSGRDMSSFMKEVERACADLIICKQSDSNILIGTESYRVRAHELANKYSMERICQLSAELVKVSSAMRIDGTMSSFLIQSVGLIQRLKEAIPVDRGLLFDLVKLQNDITELKQQIRELKKGIGERTVLAKESPDMQIDENVPSSERRDLKAGEDCEQDKEIVPDHENERSETSDCESCATSLIPKDFQEASKDVSMESDRNNNDEEEDDDDYDVMSLMREEYFSNPVIPPIVGRRSISMEGSRDLSSSNALNENVFSDFESVKPIPRGQTTAASMPTSSARMSNTGAGLGKTAEELKQKLMEAAKEEADILEFLETKCKFTDCGTHLRINGSGVWKCSMLQMFISRKAIKNIEVECDG